MDTTLLNNIVLLGIAALTAFTSVMAFMANRKAEATRVDIKELAVNTNSIKDALVKVTGEAAHAAGMSEERDRQSLKEQGAAEANEVQKVNVVAAVPIEVKEI